MIDYERLFTVKYLRNNEKLSGRAIAKRLGCHRRTVARYLRMRVPGPEACGPKRSVCSPFRTNIVEGLQIGLSLADIHRDLTQCQGFRVLCDWPAATAAPDLLALAGNAGGPVEHVLALRGYVRLAGSMEKPVPMYASALKTARRPEEKRLVLSSLGSCADLAALDLAQSLLGAEGLAREAAVATLGIGERLLGAHADRAKEAGRKVLGMVQDEALKNRANNLAKGTAEATGKPLAKGGSVTEWLGSGPFRKDGVTELGPHDVPFVPESATPADAKWSLLTKGISNGKINLVEALGRGGSCAGYVHTRIWSPNAQKARIELGYDDSGLVWLNGKVVHSNKRTGPAKAGMAKVDVPLSDGWNELMLKVTNAAGRWEFCCALRKPSGGDLPGLKMAVAPLLDGKPVITPVPMQKAHGAQTIAAPPARARNRPRAQVSGVPDAASAAKIAAAVPMKARMTPRKPRKILVLSYQSHNPGRMAGRDALKLMAERTKAFELTLVEDAKELPKVVMPDYLTQFDAVYVNNSTGGAGKAENGRELVEDLDAYVRGGRGLIGIHAATDNRFGEIIGGASRDTPGTRMLGLSWTIPTIPSQPRSRARASVWQMRSTSLPRGLIPARISTSC